MTSTKNPLNRDARFFQPHLLESRIPTSFQELLETRSGIPVQDQVAHILRVRNQAYTTHPYPCLGRFRFLDLDLAAHPLYDDVLLILKGRHLVIVRVDDDDDNNDIIDGGNTSVADDDNNNDIIGGGNTSVGDDDDDDDAAAAAVAAAAATGKNFAQPLFLDLGTCLGQDIRKLLHDGGGDIQQTQIYGADLNPSFLEFGYELFRDEETLARDRFLIGSGCNILCFPDGRSQFKMPSDGIDLEGSAIGIQKLRDTPIEKVNKDLNDLQDSVDIIHATAVFHLFSLEDQKKAARSCLRLLRKNSSGPTTAKVTTTHKQTTSGPQRKLILGAQAGNIDNGERTRPDGTKVYRHNETSWKNMWENVIAESEDDEWKTLGTKIEVWSKLVLPTKNMTTTTTTTTATKTMPTTETDTDTDTDIKTNRSPESLFRGYETQPQEEKEAEGDRKTTWNSRVVGSVEDGVRWHLFYIWVEFGS